MTDKMKDNTKFISRELPPAFTSGFRIGTSDDICVIELIDAPDDDLRKVIYSFAITKKQAKHLTSALEKFIDGE